jgi:hypothetical protein
VPRLFGPAAIMSQRKSPSHIFAARLRKPSQAGRSLALRTDDSQSAQEDFIQVTPRPIFSRLKGPDDRMPGSVKMSRGVPIRGRVAATHVAAGQTESEVDPRRTDLQAFLTAVRAGNGVGINLIKMCTLRAHDSPFAQLLSHFYFCSGCHEEEIARGGRSRRSV